MNTSCNKVILCLEFLFIHKSQLAWKNVWSISKISCHIQRILDDELILGLRYCYGHCKR